MREIYNNLYIGSAADYENKIRYKADWKVIQACKEPYHRKALGYTTRAASKTHPEYLIARRNNHLILNMIDPDDPRYIPKEIIDVSLDFIDEALSSEQNILIHCNQGQSRAPSIGLLYLASRTDAIPNGSLMEAKMAFKKLYPLYSPAKGIFGFMRAHWKHYCPAKIS